MTASNLQQIRPCLPVLTANDMLRFGYLAVMQVESGVSMLGHWHVVSQFWAFGVSYQSLIGQMRDFKKGPLKSCSFDASPQSEWLITVHLERIWNQHCGGFWGVGVSYQSLMKQMQTNLQKRSL